MSSKSIEVSVLGRIGYDLFAVEQGRTLASAEHFSRHLGGSSANIAVGLARLGLSVGIISRLGKDPLADYLLDFLRKESVNTEFVKLVEGYSTSLSLSQVSPPDQFSQVFYRQRPADTQVVVGDQELKVVRSSRMFVTNGTSLSASLTVVNVTDKHLLIDNSLTFDGFHWDDPREIYGEIHYKFGY